MMDSVCVFCGSSDSVHPDYLTAARQMGRTLAGRKLRLIYGGGRTGLMGALADGALQAGAEVIGVIIPSMNTPALARLELTRMDVAVNMHHRKARMHELAQAYIALPGGLGTFDELFETLTWAQIGAHDKAVGLLNVRNYFDPLLAALDHAVSEGFIFPEHRAVLCCDADPDRLLDQMAAYVHPHEAVKRWMRQG
jgi:uncharacterized protein (TIGR00730 family)